ncbi:hypothetical protein [Oceanicoccus sp. KOV_DT_Chl]|uniref:hypothetical protein n=1 Tax=Oceanicoccus sp. KOV_DT_Chl TaxID=1904639 RepID=UPI000C7B4184|nr:hypothetical protein [Oceanicoccus sp. KOV_DT_Chl]
MKKLFSIIVLPLLLQACGSNTVLPLQDISKPPLNQTNTISLGEPMLMQGRGYYTDILRVGNIDAYGVRITAGDFCRVPGGDKYVSFNGRAVGLKNAFGIVIGYTNELAYDEDDNEICASGTFTLCYDTDDGQYAILKNRFCEDPRSFQQIIEFNGKVSSILKFTYREFSGDRMRAPYTTDFTMDLDEGSAVNYKGARLEIIKATNQQITYKVLQNFNNAAF